VELDGVEVAAPGDDDELLAVNEALGKLAAQHKLEAELVKLRFLVGMTLEEAGQVLGISARTADNYWAHARAWLFREIKAGRTSVLAFPFQRQLRVMAGARSFRF
jgi:DNA-directed RNA polymerase specialized sigma24 family protein